MNMIWLMNISVRMQGFANRFFIVDARLRVGRIVDRSVGVVLVRLLLDVAGNGWPNEKLNAASSGVQLGFVGREDRWIV